MDCVFPFIYKDVKYEGCSKADVPEGKLWCSTLTKENDIHVNENWGYCNPRHNCPVHETNEKKENGNFVLNQCI